MFSVIAPLNRIFQIFVRAQNDDQDKIVYYTAHLSHRLCIEETNFLIIIIFCVCTEEVGIMTELKEINATNSQTKCDIIYMYRDLGF